MTLALKGSQASLDYAVHFCLERFLASIPASALTGEEGKLFHLLAFIEGRQWHRMARFSRGTGREFMPTLNKGRARLGPIRKTLG